MTPDGHLRVSDAERDAVAADLREHHADGRLDLDELSSRLDTVFAARTRNDLAAVTADLPSRRQPQWGGPNRFGADRLGADRLGADWNGADRLGADWNGLVHRRPGPISRRPRPLIAALAVLAVLWLGGGVLGLVFGEHHGPGLSPLLFLLVLFFVVRSRRRRRSGSPEDRDRSLRR